MSVQKNVFDDNIKRVIALKNIYNVIGPGSSSRYKRTDILRAATVLLHSSFEEYYRGVVTEWLPKKGNESALKVVALPEDAGRNKASYSLYDLMQKHSSKTVKELFEESVEEHMSRSSFNSYSEICSWGNKIGIDFHAYNKASELDKAIKRRHKIVHEADLQLDSSGKKTVNSIKESDVDSWIQAYRELVDVIEGQISTW